MSGHPPATPAPQGPTPTEPARAGRRRWTHPTSERPLSADRLPASGAWRVGDPVGHRQFLTHRRRPPVRPRRRRHARATSRWPTRPGASLDADAGNAVLVCHALTGDRHAVGPERARPPDRRAGGTTSSGPAGRLDTERYFVVCVNVLGGCQGTTGPASIDPSTGRPYGSTLPGRDDPRHGPHPGRGGRPPRHRPVADGRRRLDGRHAGPRVGRHVPRPGALARRHRHQRRRRRPSRSPWSSVGRSAIALDPALARRRLLRRRARATVPTRAWPWPASWPRSPTAPSEVFDDQFGRGGLDPMDDRFTLWQRFDVEGYLDYHGAKLVRRFDANSYLVINQAMDLHDLGRGRGGVDAAAAPPPGAVPGHQHQQRRAVPAPPAAAAPRPARRAGHALPVPRRSTAPTATTGSCSRPTRWAVPLAAFLAEVQKDHDRHD